jgi:hypothetical protein
MVAPRFAPSETTNKMIDHWKMFMPTSFFTRLVFPVMA